MSPGGSCISTWMCLQVVKTEWRRNAVGCDAEPALDPAICADDAALCDAIAARTVGCEDTNAVSGASDTSAQCLAKRADFDATCRDEVECVLESCFAGAACHVECRKRIALVPSSALGEALIDGCLLVGNAPISSPANARASPTPGRTNASRRSCHASTVASPATTTPIAWAMWSGILGTRELRLHGVVAVAR